MKRLAAALLLALSASAAQAQTPPEGIVWIALNDINAAYADPDDPTNRPPIVKTPPAGMIRAVDVSHDGKPDWLIDYQQAGVNGMCGTGGCLQRLYVSDGDAYVRAFDQQALSLSFRDVADETRIDIWGHHLYCSDQVADCKFSFAWDAKALRLVERPAPDGRTRLSGAGFAPIDETIERAPDGPADWAMSERRLCPVDSSEGYDVREAVLANIADIDGDGLRDWIGTPALRCGADEPTPGYTVFVSNGANQATLAYTAEPDLFFELDISTTPARIYERPACADGQTCAPIPLVWNATARTLARGS